MAKNGKVARVWDQAVIPLGGTLVLAAMWLGMWLLNVPVSWGLR